MKPFDHKHYHRNSDSADNPCVICGKDTPNPVAMIQVIDGGALIGPPEPQEDDPGYMGYFPIGSTCWRKNAKQLQALGYKKDKPPAPPPETRASTEA